MRVSVDAEKLQALLNAISTMNHLAKAVAEDAQQEKPKEEEDAVPSTD